jgi:aminotransferase in exopolysaccharide biosynthesis
MIRNIKIYNEFVSFVRSYYEKTEGFISLHEPRFVGNDRKYVIEAIDSTFVSSVGKFVDEFEKMVCEYTGSKYAIATVNGTSALHLSLLLAGVKNNDLVITQPLSFIATCNAISYIGAEPLFVDVDLNTLGLSAAKLRQFLYDETTIINDACFHKSTKKKISACVPMHTFGNPVEIEAIAKLCEEFKIPLVEDSAESLGSLVNGKHSGTFGLLGAFSFNGNKTITCGGGGIIITNDEKLGKLAKHLSTQAKVPHKWDFVHDYIGYNYRLPNLNAALACAQMEKLEDFISRKRDLAQKYFEFFSDKPGFEIRQESNESRSNYWLNVLMLENRESKDAFLKFTNENGIMTRPAWTLMNKLSMFKDCISYDLTNSNFIEDRLVNLPSSVKI